jgi:MFS family permease
MIPRRAGALPNLGPRAWAVLAFDFMSNFGTGLALPYFVVYLSQVRDLPVEIAALALSTVAAAGLVGTIASGPLIDRTSAWGVLAGGLVTAGIGITLIAFVDSAPMALLAAAVYGLGIMGLVPALQTLLVRLTPRAEINRVYSVYYATQNAGLGAGALVGGLLANLHEASSFMTLYLLDAATFVAFAMVLVLARSLHDGRDAAASEAGGGGGYARVFADRGFRVLWLLMIGFVALGYAQVEATFPVFATEAAGVSPGVLGLAFAANTLSILPLQLIVLSRSQGVRRMRAVAVLAVAWATSWVLLLTSQAGEGSALAVLLLVAAMLCFAFGECLLAVTLPGGVNVLAPERLRGRYNAAFAFAFPLGRIVGPAAAGAMLGAGLLHALVLGIAALTVVLGVAALLADRSLPADVQNV